MTVPLRSVFLTAALVLGAGISPGLAQEEDYAWSENWEWQATPFLWSSEIEGTLGIGDVSGEIKAGSQEIWRVLNLSFSAWLEANRRKMAWWIGASVADLDGTDTADDGTPVDVSLRVVQPEFAVAYRFVSTTSFALEGYAGARVLDVREQFQPQGASLVEGRETWFDPIVGVRARGGIGERVPVFLRADVGGFNVGAEFAWNVGGGVGYMVNRWIVPTVGYRYYSTKYEDEDLPDRFLYDVDQRGPQLGVTFLF